MKTKAIISANPAFFMVLFFAMASVSLAAQPSSDKTTAKEVKQKVAEAAEALKSYTVDQRDEALKKAKAMLDELDARIDRMESRLNIKWDHMDRVARRKATDSLTALRKQRNEVAEWYGELKQSSGHAWEDVKKGFLNSYQKLRNSFDKARSEF
jgi:long-subunit acyl-CoA synthetase (AMP-forming)